ncbi:MAG: 30S ribosomal protein S17 [Planctomycetota bacterium]
MRSGRRKTLVGTVHSDRMQKTITVDVETRYRDPKYGKYVLRTRRYAAHDEQEQAGVGDLVEIAETRPISRTKRWRLVRILQTGHKPEEIPS